MEISMRDHLLKTTEVRGLLNEHVRDVIRLYIREKVDESFWTDIPTEEIIKIEEFSVSLVAQMASWKNEKKQREKLTNELQEFIQLRISKIPHEFQTVPALEMMGFMTNVAIEAPYQAIFARAGRAFAEKSLFMMLILTLDLPSWLKYKFDSGEFGLRGN